MLLHSPGCQKLPKKGEILRRRQRTVDTFMDSCHWSGVVESAVCPNDRDAEVKVCVCRCAGTTSSSNGWFFQCPGPLLPSNTVEYWHKKTMRHTSRIFSAQQFFLSNKISSLPPPQRSRPCCPGSLPHYDESVRCPLSLIPSATAKQRGRRTKMKRCCTCTSCIPAPFSSLSLLDVQNLLLSYSSKPLQYVHIASLSVILASTACARCCMCQPKKRTIRALRRYSRVLIPSGSRRRHDGLGNAIEVPILAAVFRLHVAWIGGM